MKTKDKYIVIPHYMILIKSISEGKKTISEIHRDTKITLAHLYNVNKTLIEEGFVEMSRIDGVKKAPMLTIKGKLLLRVVNDLIDALGYDDKDIELNLQRSKIKHKLTELSETEKQKLDKVSETITKNEDDVQV